MDCPISVQYRPALVGFSAPNQHGILQYLALLATRQYADTTRAAVVTTLHVLMRHLTGERTRVLTEDLTQATAQDISACITAAQASGLAPSTIHTKVGLLAGFFAYLREEGQMTQQPVLRRRHRLLTPTVLPKPIRGFLHIPPKRYISASYRESELDWDVRQLLHDRIDVNGFR
jgi:hypothetical protein